MTRITLFLLSLALALPAFAGDTFIELSSEPIDLASASSPLASVSAAGGIPVAATGNSFSNDPWIVPFVVDTDNPGGTTTLFSVTVHLVFGLEAIRIEFFDEEGNEFQEQVLPATIPEVHPFNLRDQPGLFGATGLQRGFVRITPTSDAYISVDRYVITPDQDYAAGGLAIDYQNLACSTWSTRVLVGGPFTGGTRLNFLINGPQGSDPADPPSIIGSVFDEEGDFRNSFSVRTDNWVLELDAADLMEDDELFGAIDLTIFSFGGDGYVTTDMGAEGRYSAGMSGICLD